MLKKLVLENFRGFTTEYNFGASNGIVGRNGAGKSSIKEALSFLFTGCDSTGRRAPVHLISWGAPGCRVEVHTENAVLTRTLSQDKKNTLRIDQAGRGVSMSQADLENRLSASSELFMSIFLPGYFTRLPGPKQLAVLSEVLPPIDRRALLSELVGTPVSESDISNDDLSKRPDITAAKLADDRRTLQRSVDFSAGRLNALLEKKDRLEEPRPPVELELMPHLEQIRLSWVNYRTKLEIYRGAEKLYNATVAANEAIKERRLELAEELKKIVYAEEPRIPDLAGRLTEIRQKLRPVPEKPALMAALDDDRCHTCGQVVAQKHREQAKRQNEKLLATYTALYDEVKENNDRVNEEIKIAYNNYEHELARINQLRDRNNRTRTLEAQLKGELSGLQEKPLPTLPLKPEEPFEVYNEEEATRVRDIVKTYTLKKAEYDYVQNEVAANFQEAEKLRVENNHLAERVNWLKKLEQALLTLPSEELKRSSEALSMNRYKMIVEDTVHIFDEDGRPYESLSTGEQMKADIAVSMKFNSMAKKRVGMIFIDNADLIDDLPSDLSAQTFLAIVDKNIPAVEIVAPDSTTWAE